MLYDEDSAEERLASRPKWDRDRFQPDGMSAPPEPVARWTEPEIRAVEEAKQAQQLQPIVYLDPVPILYDALSHLFYIASVCPEIVQHCKGTLDECREALDLARSFRAPKGA